MVDNNFNCKKIARTNLPLFIQGLFSGKTLVQFVWSLQLFLRERDIIQEGYITKRKK